MKTLYLLKKSISILIAFMGGIQFSITQIPKYGLPMSMVSVELAKFLLKVNSYGSDKIRDIPQINRLIAFEELMRQNESFTPEVEKYGIWW